jgi:hypothetical protein
MRSLCMLLALAAAASIACAGDLRADEPQDHQATKAAQDPNYRYHNGQWWYWMPQQKNWKVWNGSQWNDYRPGATRSFSYVEDGAAQAAGETYVPTYRQGFTGFPGSVSNTQIRDSYGFRSAGSKTEGRY